MTHWVAEKMAHPGPGLNETLALPWQDVMTAQYRLLGHLLGMWKVEPEIDPRALAVHRAVMVMRKE